MATPRRLAVRKHGVDKAADVLIQQRCEELVGRCGNILDFATVHDCSMTEAIRILIVGRFVTGLAGLVRARTIRRQAAPGIAAYSFTQTTVRAKQDGGDQEISSRYPKHLCEGGSKVRCTK